MRRPELVIFDCDGVLVDSEWPSNEVMARNISRYGIELSTEECMRMFVGNSMDMVQKTLVEMGAKLPDNWIDEVYKETFARLEQGVEVVEGVLDIIERLQALGIPVCVASNGSEEKMRITLGQNDLLRKFDDAIFSAHSLGVSKPDPTLFLHAAAAFGISPARSVVIEDSVLGIKGAVNAGMQVYGYAPHGNEAALAEAGGIVFNSMDALFDPLGL
ncbi:MAG: HAD family phosphatase [Proteobacteria bacterium]|nr:HAD family phosphatase [Pseudomonadota bacterium]